MGLPPSHRLKKHQDFRSVYNRGRSYVGDLLILKVISLPPDESAVGIAPTRLGVAISKKVSKKAVVRNRIKRQLKSAFQMLLAKVYPGFWVVAIAKPQAIGCKYEHFLRELEELLRRASMIHGD